MPMIECEHCGAVFQPKSRPLGDFVRCRECGLKNPIAGSTSAGGSRRGTGTQSPARRKKRRRPPAPRPENEQRTHDNLGGLIYRLIGVSIFVGTLINWLNAPEIGEHVENWDARTHRYIYHVAPFWVLGLLGAYCAWNGPPEIKLEATTNRKAGFRDIGIGVGLLIAGSLLSALLSLLAPFTGVVVVATGMLLGGFMYVISGIVKIVTGRDTGLFGK